MIGPAAMNGPTPGIAMAPMPARSPSAPPRMPPVVAPVAVPSGAFVCFSCANCFVPWRSGSRTEMSLFEKPDWTSDPTARSAAIVVG
jgi:hypothetical protein